MSLRIAEGKLLQWIDTRREVGFSNFLFVDQFYGAHPVMRRIFSLARKHDFRSILVEELDSNCSEILESDDEALKKGHNDFSGSTVHRISFLKSAKDVEPADQDFIGSVIFKSDSFSGLPSPRQHVYEALIPPLRGINHNNYIHCSREYEFYTAVGRFSQRGSLYAQQNDLTFVCAHVALRTALSALLPEGDITYRRINDMLGIDHKTVKVGAGRGLEPVQMERVLRELSIPYEKIVHEPTKGMDLPTDYQRHLYGCIESGAPALLGFEFDDPSAQPGAAARHIIPILGHTFNEDAWVPEAQRYYFAGGLSFYSSESWLSTFVAHDDNFGPYYCLPRNFLKKDNFRLILATKRVQTLLSAVEAEALAFGYARRLGEAFAKLPQVWLARFSVFSRLGSLVIRTQCIQKEDYRRHLHAINDWDGNVLSEEAINDICTTLPESLWLAELSAPELFSGTRRKFGELIIAMDQPASTDLSLLLAARLPTLAVVRNEGSLHILPTEVMGHTQLLTR